MQERKYQRERRDLRPQQDLQRGHDPHDLRAIRDPAPFGPFVCSKGGEGIAELREVSARVEGIASGETRFVYGYRVMTSAPRAIPGNLATIPSPIFVQCK